MVLCSSGFWARSVYLQPLGSSNGDWSESRNTVGAGDGGGSLIAIDDDIEVEGKWVGDGGESG